MKLRKPPLVEFFNEESLSGFLILVFASLGLVISNSPFSGNYFRFFENGISVGSGWLLIELTIQKFINYVLMTIFFFVVGLEIKRELVSGHLASIKNALMPFVAAFGGIIFPALIYLSIAGDVAPEGWGATVATDIALAIGLISLIGSKAPSSLRTFLLGLAIIDDVGAILIIAFVYSTEVKPSWLGLGLISVALIFLMQKLKVMNIAFYAILGSILWFSFYKTGVHPTLAGVILGLMTPNILRQNQPADSEENLIEWLEHKFHPISAYLVIPIFAFANTGIEINSEIIKLALQSPISWGIFFGLTLGKPLGIFVSALVFKKFGLARLPNEISNRHLLATGGAAGIGFTVSIFIAELAFTDSYLQQISIIAVIFASIISAVISVAMFSLSKK